MNRREKGLCFRCGEPYSPLHRCVQKSLQVTVMAEDEGDEEINEGLQEPTLVPATVNEETSKEYGTLEQPLFSVSGLSQPQTMKLRGKVAHKEVVVMIDSGPSHNFVSRVLAETMQMRIDETVKFGVFLGDGCRVTCQGVCPNLRVDFGTCELNIVGYLFELGGVDVILGVDWLRTLG